MRAYYAAHSEQQVRSKRRAHTWAQLNAKQRTLIRRRYDLKRRIGITVEEYDQAFEDQNGRCAICGLTEVGHTKQAILNADHDHVTRQFRGLLCHRCNMALGLFKDNIDVLARAISYLKQGIIADAV